MTVSRAQVHVDRPARYGPQLVHHLGRRSGSRWDTARARGEITLDAGTARLTAQDGVLVLVVEGRPVDLEGLEDVVARHLVRFAADQQLDIDWIRDDPTS